MIERRIKKIVVVEKMIINSNTYTQRKIDDANEKFLLHIIEE